VYRDLAGPWQRLDLEAARAAGDVGGEFAARFGQHDLGALAREQARHAHAADATADDQCTAMPPSGRRMIS